MNPRPPSPKRTATLSPPRHLSELASGQGVEKELERARDLALRSADSGDVESYLWLLRGYRAGGVFGENPRESALLAGRVSALLHQRIAEHNDPRAMRHPAVIHYQGLGVPQDSAQAMRCLDGAAELRQPEYAAHFGEIRKRDGG